MYLVRNNPRTLNNFGPKDASNWYTYFVVGRNAGLLFGGVNPCASLARPEHVNHPFGHCRGTIAVAYDATPQRQARFVGEALRLHLGPWLFDAAEC